MIFLKSLHRCYRDFAQHTPASQRLVFFNESPSEKRSESTKSEPIKPIDRQRIEKNIFDAYNLLRDLDYEANHGEDPTVPKDAVATLKQKLEKIEGKYRKIDTTVALNDIEKEIYAEIGPLLKKGVERNLKNCRNIKNPLFEKQGMSFTMGAEKVVATLDKNYKIEAVKISGIAVTFFEPVTMTMLDTMDPQLTTIVQSITKDFHNPKNIEVILSKWNHYEVLVTGENGSKKFIATTQDILEVAKEASSQEIIRYNVARKRVNNLTENLNHDVTTLQQIFKDKPEVLTVLDSILSAPFTFTAAEFLIDTTSFSPDQKEQWQKFLKQRERFEILSKEEEELRQNYNTTVLKGTDKSGKPFKVIEEGSGEIITRKYLGVVDAEHEKWDDKGKPLMDIKFFDGRILSRVTYENGKPQREYTFDGAGALMADIDLQKDTRTSYDGKGNKTFLGIFDPHDKDKTIINAQFYNDGGVLLDGETIDKTMSITEIQEFFLKKLGKVTTTSVSDAEKDEVTSGCLCAAKYITYCPRGKEILRKVAELHPLNAFKFYGKYKSTIYAKDILEHAAYNLKKSDKRDDEQKEDMDKVEKILRTGEQFSDLSPAEKDRIIKLFTQKEANAAIARNLLNNPLKFTDREDELMKDQALMHLSEVQDPWLEPYWNKLKKPEEVNDMTWRAQIKAIVTRNLYFQNKTVDQNNVAIEFERIVAMREKLKKTPLFQGRNVVCAAHSEMLEDTKNGNKKHSTFQDIEWEFSSGDAHRFGKRSLLEAIQTQQNGQGSLVSIRPEKDYGSLLKAKEDTLQKIQTTSPPLTFLFDGHGDANGLYFSDGQIAGVTGTTSVTETAETTKISVAELAQALIKRSKNFPNLKSEDTILIFSACYSATFIRNLYLQIGNIPKPIALGMAEYGQYGHDHLDNKFGSEFFSDVLGLTTKTAKNPTTIGDVFDNEFKQTSDFYEHFKELDWVSNPSLYLGNENNETMQIAKNEQREDKHEEIA